MTIDEAINEARKWTKAGAQLDARGAEAIAVVGALASVAHRMPAGYEVTDVTTVNGALAYVLVQKPKPGFWERLFG